MKTYFIYNILTDEFLGTVEADSIAHAELKAAQTFKYDLLSIYLAAYTEKQ